MKRKKTKCAKGHCWRPIYSRSANDLCMKHYREEYFGEKQPAKNQRAYFYEQTVKSGSTIKGDAARGQSVRELLREYGYERYIEKEIGFKKEIKPCSICRKEYRGTKNSHRCWPCRNKAAKDRKKAQVDPEIIQALRNIAKRKKELKYVSK